MNGAPKMDMHKIARVMLSVAAVLIFLAAVVILLTPESSYLSITADGVRSWGSPASQDELQRMVASSEEVEAYRYSAPGLVQNIVAGMGVFGVGLTPIALILMLLGTYRLRIERLQDG